MGLTAQLVHELGHSVISNLSDYKRTVNNNNDEQVKEDLNNSSSRIVIIYDVE